MTSSSSRATEGFSLPPLKRLAGALWAGGYLLYFSVLALPTPTWARKLVAEIADYIPVIGTPEVMSVLTQSDTFPAQVVILYAMISALVILLLPLTWLRPDSEIVQEIYVHPAIEETRRKKTSVKFILTSVMPNVMSATFSIYVFFFFFEPSQDYIAKPGVYARTIQLYSGDIVSISLHLIAGVLMPSLLALSYLAAYVVLFPDRCVIKRGE